MYVPSGRSPVWATVLPLDSNSTLPPSSSSGDVPSSQVNVPSSGGTYGLASPPQPAVTHAANASAQIARQERNKLDTDTPFSCRAKRNRNLDARNQSSVSACPSSRTQSGVSTLLMSTV